MKSQISSDMSGVELAAYLDKQFQKYNLSAHHVKNLVNASTDFGDIYDAAKNIRSLIDKISTTIHLNPQEACEALYTLEVEIEHINWHFKESRKARSLLKKLCRRAEVDSETQG